MEIKLKENVNYKSLVLKHNILIEATSLLVGREGALESEQELYTLLATIDNLSENNIIEECNDDKRELLAIIKEDVEPVFLKLMEDTKFQDLWYSVRGVVLSRCRDIWDRQNSLRGVIEGLIDSLATIDEEGKEKVLAATGEVAKQVYEKRTEKMEKATQEVNSKLEQLVAKYERDAKAQKNKVEEKPKKEEIKENESDTE